MLFSTPNPGSGTIAKLSNALLLGAMIAAKETAILLQAVSDDPDTTRRTSRCESMDRALETVVGVGLAVFRYLEGLIIVISASVTLWHEHHYRF
jgi:hypothetical protein